MREFLAETIGNVYIKINVKYFDICRSYIKWISIQCGNITKIYY